MQCTPYQLKDRLIGFLDQDNNVADMHGVLEVVTMLEAYPVTRNMLEETRLGKYVNEMRRKTDNRELAKRAKNLVRKWKNLVETPGCLPSTGSAVNGGGTNDFICTRTQTTNINSPSLHDALSNSSHCTANSPSSHMPSSPVSCLTSTPLPGHVPSGFSTATPILPGCVDASTSDTSQSSRNHLSKSYSSSRKRRREGAICETGAISAKRLLVVGATREESPNPANGEHTTAAAARTNNAPTETHSFHPVTHSNQKNTSCAKRSNSQICSNDLEHLQKTKPTKVKTTAQLIEEMSASGQIQVNNNKTVSLIANNRIEKEVDIVDMPVVPPEAKPRPRRKPGSNITTLPSASDTSLQQIKNEMVQKFLRDSVALPKPVNCEWEHIDHHNATNKMSSEIIQHKTNHSGDMVSNDEYSHFSTISPTVVQSLNLPNTNNSSTEESARKQLMSDPWSCLPPLNLAEIDWTSDSYEVAAATQSTAAGDMPALHEQHWAGVNGQHDKAGAWFNWTQTYSMPTHGGDLHILPYVDIDL